MYLVNGVVRHDLHTAENTSITMSAESTVVDLLDAEGINYKSIIYRIAEKVTREGF